MKITSSFANVAYIFNTSVGSAVPDGQTETRLIDDSCIQSDDKTRACNAIATLGLSGALMTTAEHVA